MQTSGDFGDNEKVFKVTLKWKKYNDLRSRVCEFLKGKNNNNKIENQVKIQNFQIKFLFMRNFWVEKIPSWYEKKYFLLLSTWWW